MNRRRSIRIGLAAALATVGRTDSAMTLLERAVARGEYVRTSPNPVWDPLRSNPRFVRLLEVEEGRARQAVSLSREGA
jgi:hypothetical protein